GDSMIRNNLGSDQLSTVENDIANIRQSDAYTNEMHVDHSRTVQRMNMLQQQRSLLRRKSASV
ncbi:MAG: hypothetical protein JXR78_16765, partial [Victivallales bacterium]|nr:hypothetical protein [Victivallales bacterium]